MSNSAVTAAPIPDRLIDMQRAARLLEDTAACLEHVDRPEIVRLALHLAAVVHEGSGSPAEAARVRAEIPAHEDGGDRPVCGWESLTWAELRVARTVTKGLSNGEAAQRLFLSRYTVETHLRHIFQKLGVRSRVQLTRFVLEHPEQALLG